MRRLVLVVALLLSSAVPASAAPGTDVLELPDATSAEGIAVGRGATFYAGDLFAGDLFVGDLRRGTVERFRDVPTGRMATGMAVDRRSDLLFVGGALTGQGYVYDARTGQDVAVHQLADPSSGTLVNDVVVTRDAAWFTDSFQPRLYRIDLGPGGRVAAEHETLELSGPAAGLTGEINLNGIAATPDGSQLIVSHTADAALYGVDPTSGESWPIAGVELPFVDGILLEAGRLWAVQNFANQVSVVRLAPDLRSGTIERVITDPAFQVPTTVARHGDRLALVNGKFDTGLPPSADSFEVVVVGAR
jgi:sugar lactone lactonase YvrE